MLKVQTYIQQKQQEFALHPFFERLQRNDGLGEVLPFAPKLLFWAMTFQDVIRLNELQIHDPRLREIAHEHRGEEAGHDQWLLTDLIKIEGTLPSVRSLFGSGHASTRDASYALVAEVFRATTDLEHLILLLVLESTGQCFLEFISDYCERKGVSQSFRYLSHFHLDAEAGHAVFEQKLKSYLDALRVPDGERWCAMAMVDRVFQAFNHMLDGFEHSLAHHSAREATACQPAC